MCRKANRQSEKLSPLSEMTSVFGPLKHAESSLQSYQKGTFSSENCRYFSYLRKVYVVGNH